jgi:hypothetical protein
MSSDDLLECDGLLLKRYITDIKKYMERFKIVNSTFQMYLIEHIGSLQENSEFIKNLYGKLSGDLEFAKEFLKNIKFDRVRGFQPDYWRFFQAVIFKELSDIVWKHSLWYHIEEKVVIKTLAQDLMLENI